MEFWGESQKDKENTDAVDWSPNSLRQAFLKGGDGTQVWVTHFAQECFQGEGEGSSEEGRLIFDWHVKEKTVGEDKKSSEKDREPPMSLNTENQDED